MRSVMKPERIVVSRGMFVIVTGVGDAVDEVGCNVQPDDSLPEFHSSISKVGSRSSPSTNSIPVNVN